MTLVDSCESWEGRAGRTGEDGKGQNSQIQQQHGESGVREEGSDTGITQVQLAFRPSSDHASSVTLVCESLLLVHRIAFKHTKVGESFYTTINLVTHSSSQSMTLLSPLISLQLSN